MGIKKIISSELIDVIEWKESADQDILVQRYTRPGDAIKMGARLTVREGQVAVFVNEGVIADVFKPGLHRLQTANLPVLTTLRSWKHGFDSPFKCEVYFVVTTQKVGLKWGTTTPILLKDKDLGVVRLRAYGSYALQIVDPVCLIKQLSGTKAELDSCPVDEALRPFIISLVTDTLGKSGIPILEMVGNYGKISEIIRAASVTFAKDWGLALPQFVIENVSLPPNVEAAVDKRTSMGIVGDLQKFTQYQMAEAIREAASAGGDSTAGLGAGMGIGMAMAQQVTKDINAQHSPQGATPPTLSFFAVLNGQKLGPLSPEQMNELISSGKLGSDDLVWREGLESWIAAKDLAELKTLFKKVPPPLPS